MNNATDSCCPGYELHATVIQFQKRQGGEMEPDNDGEHCKVPRLISTHIAR
jgi:hypothetical protein